MYAITYKGIQYKKLIPSGFFYLLWQPVNPYTVGYIAGIHQIYMSLDPPDVYLQRRFSQDVNRALAKIWLLWAPLLFPCNHLCQYLQSPRIEIRHSPSAILYKQ